MPSRRTRLRAWLVGAVRGRRSRDEAQWEESAGSSGPARTFQLAGLSVEATPKGVRAAGDSAPSAVFDVIVRRPGDSGAWTSRYGFPVGAASAARAAEAALDELFEAWRDKDGWIARATEGMTPDEAEAIRDSPAFEADLDAAAWVGPVLSPLAEERQARGAWLQEEHFTQPLGAVRGEEEA